MLSWLRWLKEAGSIVGVDRQVELLLNAAGLGNIVFLCAVPDRGTAWGLDGSFWRYR
jgi:hypothetical protein